MQVSLEPNTKPMPLKWHILLDILPEYEWDITKAALSGHIGYSEAYATTRLPALLKEDVRFCAALEKRKKAFSQKCDIRAIDIQHKLLKLADMHVADKPSASVAAYSAIMKSIGGFQADRIPDENLAGKALDASKARDIRKLIELHYAREYLAPGAAEAVEAELSDKPFADRTVDELYDVAERGPDSPQDGQTIDNGSQGPEADNGTE